MKLRISGAMKVLLSLVAVLALTAFPAGCGSDSKDSGGSGGSATAAESSTTTPAAKKPTGEPIKVMNLVSATASTGTAIVSPETAQAALATEKWVNDNGGINGRPLQVIVCDDKSDPNQVVVCARKAVAEKVVALVGSYTQFSDKAYPILEKAGIVSLGNITVTPPDFASDISFPLTAGPTVLPALGILAAKQPECKKPGLVSIDNVTIDTIKLGVLGGVAVGGKKGAYTVVLPPAATDFSSQANEAADKGDCVMLFTVPGNALAFIPALRQATDQPLIASNNAITADVAKKLGPAVDGTLVPDYFPPYGSDAMKEYRSVVEKYGDPSKYDFTFYNASNAYLSVRVFADVASTLTGTVDAASFKAALGKDSKVDTHGLTPTLDFTKAGEWKAVPFLKRVFNRSMIFTKIEGGKQVQIDGGFHDLSADGAKAFTPPKQ